MRNLRYNLTEHFEFNHLITFVTLLLSVGAVFVKILIFEAIDPELCAKYIQVFFSLQFLAPIILLGANYASSKQSIIDKERVIELNAVSIVLIIIPLFLFDGELKLIGLLAIFNAVYNQNLELQKIDGLHTKIVTARFLKPLFEIIGLLVLIEYFKVSLFYYIAYESIVLLFLTLIFNQVEKIEAIPLPKKLINFARVVLLSFRSSSLKIFVPFLYTNEYSKLFLMFFAYEIYIQFSSYIATKSILENSYRKLSVLFLLLLFTIPIQIMLLSMVAASIFSILENYVYYFPLYGCILFWHMLFPLVIKNKKETPYFAIILLNVVIILLVIFIKFFNLYDISIDLYVKFFIGITLIESISIVYLVTCNKYTKKSN